MSTNVCTQTACYLAGQAKTLSLPLITVAGLVDGINPCAIGMMVMLLGYLLSFGKKGQSKRLLRIGLLYIGSVYITYLTVGWGLYSFVQLLDVGLWAERLNRIVGSGLLVVGVIQFKDALGVESGPHLRIATGSRFWLIKLIEKMSYPTTMVLGVLVTLLETPCSLPIYMGTATILAQSGLSKLGIVFYFLYYNFLFVLPLLVVLVVIWRGKRLIEVKEWEHKAKNWMHLSLALVLVAMGIWLWLS